MDRETRVFAESHFRSLRGRLPSRVCPTPDRVDFIENPDSFSYADFFKGYLLPNLPCVFSSAFTEGWGSRKHWVTPSGKPDFDYLLQNYGSSPDAALAQSCRCDQHGHSLELWSRC
ncbi:jumonji domain containing 4 [Phyllostomus discolor]|uniref:Jumonji domain containing 4 n=1 Tax=Phyllostomus discolor TaxID=89673 RepID=A0A833ZI31_9CHIR|nr:jumonji domain containing 4 [Phyllostomus discolor]